MYAGRVNADSGVLEVAQAARAAPEAPQPPRSIDLVLDGLARRCTEGPSAGVPALRLALQAIRNEALDGHAEIMRWLLLTPIVQSMTVFELWDDDAFHALATRAVRLARDTGALALLPVALVYSSGVHLFGGELVAAEALVEEADAIAAATACCTPGSSSPRDLGKDDCRPLKPLFKAILELGELVGERCSHRSMVFAGPRLTYLGEGRWRGRGSFTAGELIPLARGGLRQPQ